MRSGTIAGFSVPLSRYPAGTHRRSPGVGSYAFGAQPLDLRLWPLMDMDFVLSCALVRPQRLLSSFCSSARTWDTRFLQTSPHGDALALLSPSPPSGWQRDLHPPSVGTCPAHMNYPAACCEVSNPSTRKPSWCVQPWPASLAGWIMVCLVEALCVHLRTTPTVPPGDAVAESLLHGPVA